MIRSASFLIVALGIVFSLGCSGEVTKAEPKLADPSKVDPRLKPAEAGGGAGTPQGGKGQGVLKGD